MHPPALVLFSGGQDSTTCLAWALERYQRIETIGFDYGQRHVIELSVRPRILDLIRRQFPKWADRLGEDRVVSMRELAQLSDTALTQAAEIRMTAQGLPNTFVPGRTLKALQVSLSLGMDQRFTSGRLSAVAAKVGSLVYDSRGLGKVRRMDRRSLSGGGS